jgi:hypothetical protein
MIASGCIAPEPVYTYTGENPDGQLNGSATTTTAAVPTTTMKPEPFLYFQFLENHTNCSIDGAVLLNNNSIGDSESGFLPINLSVFTSFGRFNEHNEICVAGRIPECSGIYENWKVERCWLLNMTSNYFDVYMSRSIPFVTTVNTHKPQGYYEGMNFVRPGDVKSFITYQRGIGFFSNETMEDVDRLWAYVDTHVSYRYDSDTSGFDYWKLPDETLREQSGDCEDWSNLFVSLSRAYNSSLRCYSLGLPNHLSSFCKLQGERNTVYGFFDQNTKVKGFYSSGDERAKIRETLNSYFAEFDLPAEDKRIVSAFNEAESFEFESNDVFIGWAMELR